MATFGDRLRRTRKALGLTQEEVGLRVDVSKQTVSNWENGHDVPSFHALTRLVEKLNAPADWLLLGPAEGRGHVRDASAAYHAGVTPDEADLLAAYRRMSPRRRAALLEMIRAD